MSARRHTMSLGRHVDALLASLADTLMGDAYREGGKHREGGKLVAFASLRASSSRS